MATPRPKNKLAEIAKYPGTYVLIAVVGLMGFFARSFVGESSGRADDCKEQLQYVNGQMSKKDSTIYALIFQLRVQDEANRQLPAVADSALRNKQP